MEEQPTVEPKEPCEHDFETIKEVIRNNNKRFSGSAFFIKKKCRKCPLVILQDYQVIQ